MEQGDRTRPASLTATGGLDPNDPMFETARRRSVRLLAAALLALTTIAVGFAHRIPALGDLDTASALRTAPDGTLLDLCHQGATDGRPGPGDAAKPSCDACRLTDAPGLVAVADLLPRPPVGTVVDRLGHGTAALTGSLLPAPLSRGPPRIG